jgi:4-hydroxy-tetrahydrodipicolinate synthase
MKPYEGLLTAMVTPFYQDGRVNEESAVALGRHLFATGSDGLVVAGSTGEGLTLSNDERIGLVELMVEELGERGSIIAGTGSASTAETVELTERAVAAGVDAVLVVTPYYIKPNPLGLQKHFDEVARAAGGKPVILYNIPSRTALNMSPELIARLGQIDGVEAVKQSNDDDLGPIDGVTVLGGNDDNVGRWLAMGGTGAICVASHIVGPEMKRMFTEPENRDEIDRSLQDIHKALAITTNPIPVKAALNLLGHEVGGLRLPLVQATEKETAEIREVLARHGLLQTAVVG